MSRNQRVIYCSTSLHSYTKRTYSFSNQPVRQWLQSTTSRRLGERYPIICREPHARDLSIHLLQGSKNLCRHVEVYPVVAGLYERPGCYLDCVSCPGLCTVFDQCKVISGKGIPPTYKVGDSQISLNIAELKPNLVTYVIEAGCGVRSAEVFESCDTLMLFVGSAGSSVWTDDKER